MRGTGLGHAPAVRDGGVQDQVHRLLDTFAVSILGSEREKALKALGSGQHTSGISAPVSE